MLNLKKQWMLFAILAIISQNNFGSARNLSRVSEALKTTKYPRTTPIVQQPYYAQPTYQPTTWADWYRSKKYGYEQRATPQKTKYTRKNYGKAAALAAGGGGLLELLRLKKSEEETEREEKKERIENFLENLSENPEQFTYHNIREFIAFNPEFVKNYQYTKKFFEALISNKAYDLQELIRAVPNLNSYFVAFLNDPKEMHLLLEKGLQDTYAGQTLATSAQMADDAEKKQLADAIYQIPEDFNNLIQNKSYLYVIDNLLKTDNPDVKDSIASKFAWIISDNPEALQENIKKYAGSSQSPVSLVFIDKLIEASPRNASLILSNFIIKNFDYLIQNRWG